MIITPNSNQPTDTTTYIISVGGTGTHILNTILKEKKTSLNFISTTINTDTRLKQQSLAQNNYQIGAKITRGLSCGGDSELAKTLIPDIDVSWMDTITPSSCVFLIAGLGGGTGSGITPFIAEKLRQRGLFVIVIATLPFNFEGSRRTSQAQSALQDLKKYADILIPFDNNRLSDLVSIDAGITQAFDLSNSLISRLITSLSTLGNGNSLLSLNLAHVKKILRQGNGEILVAYGSAQGEEREKKALLQTLASPLLKDNKTLSSASNIIIQITGDKYLTLCEIESLVNDLRSHLDNSAEINLSITTVEEPQELLSLLLLIAPKHEENTSLDHFPEYEEQAENKEETIISDNSTKEQSLEAKGKQNDSLISSIFNSSNPISTSINFTEQGSPVISLNSSITTTSDLTANDSKLDSPLLPEKSPIEKPPIPPKDIKLSPPHVDERPLSAESSQPLSDPTPTPLTFTEKTEPSHEEFHHFIEQEKPPIPPKDIKLSPPHVDEQPLSAESSQPLSDPTPTPLTFTEKTEPSHEEFHHFVEQEKPPIPTKNNKPPIPQKEVKPPIPIPLHKAEDSHPSAPPIPSRSASATPCHKQPLDSKEDKSFSRPPINSGRVDESQLPPSLKGVFINGNVDELDEEMLAIPPSLRHKTSLPPQ